MDEDIEDKALAYGDLVAGIKATAVLIAFGIAVAAAIFSFG
jgi:hypothetical protein